MVLCSGKMVRTLQLANCSDKLISLKTVFIVKKAAFSAQILTSSALMYRTQNAALVDVSRSLRFCAV